MGDVDINANVKIKKRKLEKDYKKFGLTAKDILKLKLNEIKERKEKNKTVEENQNI